MVFTSNSFLFYFLPIFLAAYFIARTTKWKNWVLLIFSLVFYAWGEPVYLLLMLLVIIVTWGFSLYVGKSTDRRRTYLFSSLFSLLGILFIFKYSGLMYATFFPGNGFNLPLPLGISFFTFQAISYLIDVYREEVEAERSLVSVACYISMFPQLVAGPIVRFSTINEEIKSREVSFELISKGVYIFITGFAMKVLLANTFAAPADAIYSIPLDQVSTIIAWFGVICYSFQIYFDFAGYSTMAVGLGYMLGFSFPQNFNYPYISQSITEFWRRWHISLSTWFRDYLYIPLGGSRNGNIKTYRNLMIVFLLCGFWHGASWTFLAWGAFHGAFLTLERAWLGSKLSLVPPLIRHCYTILVFLVGWALFRSESFDQAATIIGAMFGYGAGTTNNPNYSLQNFLTPLIMFSIPIALLASLPTKKIIAEKITTILNRSNSSFQLLFVEIIYKALYFILFLLSIVSVSAGAYNPFIYFRF